MRTGILTPWAVVQEVAVTTDDLDADGSPNELALRRWLMSAWEAYLDRCPTLQEGIGQGRVKLSIGVLRPVQCRKVASGTDAMVAIAMTEMRTSSIDMALRIRALGTGDGAIVDGRFRVAFSDASDARLPIPQEIRRALLAVEAAASRYC